MRYLQVIKIHNLIIRGVLEGKSDSLCVLSLILQPRVLNLGIGLVKKQFLFIFNVSGFLVVLVEKTLKLLCRAF